MQEPCFVWVFCRGWNVPAWAEIAENAWNTQQGKAKTHRCEQEGLHMVKCKQRAKGKGSAACSSTEVGKADEGGRKKLSRWIAWFSAWSTSTLCRQRWHCLSPPSKPHPTAQKRTKIHEKGGKCHCSSQKKARTHQGRAYRVTMTRKFLGWEKDKGHELSAKKHSSHLHPHHQHSEQWGFVHLL